MPEVAQRPNINDLKSKLRRQKLEDQLAPEWIVRDERRDLDVLGADGVERAGGRGDAVRAVQAFLAAHAADYQLEWLPSYAPELNPEELCNGAVKGALRNAQPGSVAELHRQARREFRRLARRTAELERFFQHAGLSVN